MIYNPTGPRESQWKRLPTPSCPDLDYASLYLDQMRQKIVLVLVQKPPSQAPFSRLYNHEPWKNRQPNRGGIVITFELKRNVYACLRYADLLMNKQLELVTMVQILLPRSCSIIRPETRRPLNISERLVGRFALKLTNSDITSSAKVSWLVCWLCPY